MAHGSPEHQLMLGHGNDHLIIVLKVYSYDLRSNPTSSKKVFSYYARGKRI